jgi:hypothetical protein
LPLVRNKSHFIHKDIFHLPLNKKNKIKLIKY